MSEVSTLKDSVPSKPPRTRDDNNDFAGPIVPDDLPGEGW